MIDIYDLALLDACIKKAGNQRALGFDLHRKQQTISDWRNNGFPRDARNMLDNYLSGHWPLGTLKDPYRPPIDRDEGRLFIIELIEKTGGHEVVARKVSDLLSRNIPRETIEEWETNGLSIDTYYRLQTELRINRGELRVAEEPAPYLTSDTVKALETAEGLVSQAANLLLDLKVAFQPVAEESVALPPLTAAEVAQLLEGIREKIEKDESGRLGQALSALIERYSAEMEGVPPGRKGVG